MQPPVRLAARLALADLVEADGIDGAAQGLGVVAGVEVALGDVVEGHLRRLHQALEAQRGGLVAELAGERVERDFEREAHAGAGHAAVGQDRRLVGGDRIGAAAVVREVVEAGQDRGDLARLEAGGERIGRVGAGIDACLAVERQQAAVGVGVGGQDVMVLAAVGVGGEALAAVLEPAQRRPELARRPGERHLLGEQDALVAEAAADVGGDDADLAFVEPEALGEARADDVRLLGGGVEDELAQARMPAGDHAASLDRAHDLARGPELAGDGHGGLGFDGLEVDVDAGGEEEVVAPGLVHQRRAGLARLQHVDDHGQRVEVELDLGGEVLGLGAGRGDAHRHRLADVADFAGRQDRLQRGLEAGQRGVGADGGDAGEVLGDDDALADGRRDADRADARMRQRAPQERHLQHARQLDVADVLAAPAHIAVVLLADEPRADALVCHLPLPAGGEREQWMPGLIALAAVPYRSPPISSMLSRTQSPG